MIFSSADKHQHLDTTFQHILVVDDSPVINKLLCKQLEKCGYSTIGVKTGAEAINHVLAGDDILMILDYCLPDMTGKEVIEQLAQKGKTIPFIVLTGLGDEKIAVDMMKRGAIDFLIKENGYILLLPQMIQKIYQERVEKQRFKEIQERMMMMLDIAPGLIIVHDDQGRILYANQHAYEAHGYTKEEFLNLTLLDLVVNIESSQLFVNIEKFKNRENTSFESIHYRKDKSMFYLTVNLRPVQWDGKTHLLSVSSDISEQKKIEEELKIQNIVLTTQQESSLDGILVVEKNGKIVTCNKKFLAMWGIPPEVIASKSDELAIKYVLNKLVDPQKFIDKIIYLYEHSQEQSQDELHFKDGQVFDRFSAPMIDENNNNVGRIWYFRDITDRKRVEKEQEKLINKLRQAQKMEAVGHLAAQVAHEINNPIAFVLANTEAMVDYFSVYQNIIDLYESNISVNEIEQKKNELQFNFVKTDLNKLLDETMAGIQRIAAIVGQMRYLAFNSTASVFTEFNFEQMIIELIKEINTELDFQYSITTDFGGISSLYGNISEIKNAFHALVIFANNNVIEKQINKSKKIVIKTWEDQHYAYCKITNINYLIPNELLHPLSNPNTVTQAVETGKEFNMNSAYDIVVNKHQGELHVIAENNKDSSFYIKLPKKTLKTETASLSGQ